jgi:hypothetical protein
MPIGRVDSTDRIDADGGVSISKPGASGGSVMRPLAAVVVALLLGAALYALAHAGIKPDDPVIARAHALLIQTQRDDGSWPMTSRPVKPGGEGSKSLIPITGAGSAWSVLGLVRSR